MSEWTDISVTTLVGTAGREPRAMQQLNKVLRGELSAVEAYNQIIEKFANDPQVQKLSEIKTEHEDSIRILRVMVAQEGALPADEPGFWGKVVANILAAGRLFGDVATLKMLRQGEEFGLHQYKALLKENLSSNDLSIIQNKFIPRQEHHIRTLIEMAHVH